MCYPAGQAGSDREGLETALHGWRLIASASQQLLAEGRLRAVASLASSLDAVGTTLADLLCDKDTAQMQPALDSTTPAPQSAMRSTTSSLSQPPQPSVVQGGVQSLSLLKNHVRERGCSDAVFQSNLIGVWWRLLA